MHLTCPPFCLTFSSSVSIPLSLSWLFCSPPAVLYLIKQKCQGNNLQNILVYIPSVLQQISQSSFVQSQWTD